MSLREEIWSEPELLEYFGLTKQQLADFRARGLTCYRLSNRVRLYHESHLKEFFKTTESNYVHHPRRSQV